MAKEITSPPNTPPSTEGREYWIRSDYWCQQCGAGKYCDDIQYRDGSHIRVISYDAYDQLKAELERVRGELAEWKLDCDISENAEVKLLLKYHAAKELLGSCCEQIALTLGMETLKPRRIEALEELYARLKSWRGGE